MTIFFWGKKQAKKRKKMDSVLDQMFEDLEFSLSRELLQYTVKVSQVKKSFYDLIRKPRGKILGQKKTNFLML